jgi:uncharacterized protein (DUF1015 family)
MTRVLPFRGLRFNPRVVHDVSAVVCPPYDVISSGEQKQLQASSPFNAVHLELPEDTPNEPGSRYARAAETLAAWFRDGALVPEPRPAYYLHETRFSYRGQACRRRDLLGALGVESWSADLVRPHERTMAGPKADRLQLLRATRANVSPVWVLHREQPEPLSAAWEAAEGQVPATQFALDGEEHLLWIVDDPATVQSIEQGFAQGGPLYIADGHHRYETALAFREEAGAALPGASETLAVITWANDPGLVVFPTHRVVHGLPGNLTMEELEARWSSAFHAEYFPVWENAPPEQIEALIRRLETHRGSGPTFGVLGPDPDTFAVIQVRGGKPPEGALPADRSDAWKALDVALIHALLLDPLIADIGRPRDEVLTYTRDPHEAVAAVRADPSSMAVFLNPTPVEHVLAVADARDRMPEKSTYFYPKPPTGLVIRVFPF